MDKVGREEGEGEMYGDGNTEIYNTMCNANSQWEFPVWLRELNQGLKQAEGWGGRQMGGKGQGCMYG